jgi:glycerol-3-phosphate O-acyltransferase
LNDSAPIRKDSGAAAALWSSEKFCDQLSIAAAASGKNPQQAEKYARKCLKEIEATPKDSVFKPMAALARFIYTRSYEPELDINVEALEALRAQSGDKLLLFLWSHKSHMDSFAFMLSLYDNHFKPMPLIFAGVNMNFLGFGAMARRIGAIFVRRSFQDDAIYKLVFRSYIDYLIRNRLPLTWSIEGTRSRTGKLSPPKLGILNWVLESCQREDMREVLLVPVSIAFDRIAEIDDYVAIQQGLPKRKESLRWFFDFIFGMRQPYGKIYVRYAQPIALDDPAVAAISDGSEQGPSEATRLGFEVCTRIEQITPIKSADLLTMVLLGTNGRALTSEEIYKQAHEIDLLARERKLPTASGFQLDSAEQVSAAILALKSSGLIRSHDKGNVPVYYIPGEQQLAAAYYRNTITHFFLAAAMGEIGLASMAMGIDRPDEQRLRDKVSGLRDLYKFEFFYPPSESFWLDVKRETDTRYPGWSEASPSLQTLLKEKPPRFGHAILRSISESYLVLANGLLQRGGRPVGDSKKFIAELLGQGEQFLLRKTISCEASVSQDLLATGMRLAEHRQLLDGNGLQQRREIFASDVVSALSAINLLQRSYDTAWFSRLSTGPIANLLGP